MIRFLARMLSILAVPGLLFGLAVSLSNAQPPAEKLSPEDKAKVSELDQLAAKGDAAEGEQPEIVARLVKGLEDGIPFVRVHAALGLARLGEKAKSAAPALAEHVVDKNPRVRRAALKALRKVAPGGTNETIDIIAKGLSDAEPEVRVAALSSIADTGVAALPSLTKALEHDEARYWALLVLNELATRRDGLGEQAGPMVKKITPYLKDDSADVRRETALALAAIGEPAKPAAGEVAKLLKDGDMGVQFAATFALASFGSDSATPEVTDALKAGLKSKDEFMRVESAWAVGKVMAEDEALRKEAAKALFAGLLSKSPDVRRAAVRGLVDLRPPAEAVQKALDEAFSKADGPAADDLLQTLSEAGEPAMPAIVQALKHKGTRGRAAALLGHLGKRASASVSSLTDALSDDLSKDEPEARAELAFALGAIGPDAAGSSDALIKLLADSDAPVRTAAAYALGRIGAGAKIAVPTLEKWLKSDDEFEKGVAAWALANIAPTDPKVAVNVLPTLKANLESPQPMVRRASVQALGSLGPLAKETSSAIEKLTRDSDPNVRDAATEALKTVQ